MDNTGLRMLAADLPHVLEALAAAAKAPVAAPHAEVVHELDHAHAADHPEAS